MFVHTQYFSIPLAKRLSSIKSTGSLIQHALCSYPENLFQYCKSLYAIQVPSNSPLHDSQLCKLHHPSLLCCYFVHCGVLVLILSPAASWLVTVSLWMQRASLLNSLEKKLDLQARVQRACMCLALDRLCSCGTRPFSSHQCSGRISISMLKGMTWVDFPSGL